MRYAPLSVIGVSIVALLLVACGEAVDPRPTGFDDDLSLAAITARGAVAWGERLELGVGTATVRGVRINGRNVPFTLTGSRLVFDLPPPITFPDDLPTSLREYLDRGRARVQIRTTGGRTVARTLRPVGAHVGGQINVLVRLPQPGSCAAFMNGLAAALSLSPVGESADTVLTGEGGGRHLCFATFEAVRGTQQLIDAVDAALLGRLGDPDAFAVDANVLFSLDGHSTNSFDPPCDQVVSWLDPYSVGFDPLSGADIAASVRPAGALATGAGATVVIVGGGVDGLVNSVNLINPTGPTGDSFSCDEEHDGVKVEGHDNHGAGIVEEIAPGAALAAIKICTPWGDCPSGLVSQAFIYALNTYPGTVLVNTSFGGPLPDRTLFKLLDEEVQVGARRLLIVASAGNGGPAALRHYPASYAPGTPAPGSLPNVVAVGAVGVESATGAWVPAAFNITGNAEVFAAGVNLCPDSVTFRCNAGDPDGISGTSFAAPVAAGVAALYHQRCSTDPLAIHRLLIDRAQPVPGARVTFDPNC